MRARVAGGATRRPSMFSRYSHVRMEAKRRALDVIAARQSVADEQRKAGLNGATLRRSLNQWRWFSSGPAANTGRGEGPREIQATRRWGSARCFMERAAIRHVPVNLWFL